MSEIDLDNFDENEYFESPGHKGHCANIALALNKLTGWSIYSLRCPGQAHAVVLSPLGYVDGNGPGAKERFFERHSKPDEEGRIAEVTKHWWYMTYGPVNDDVTERAIPIARAVLARWFPNFQPIASQMPLFPDLEEDDF